jgi:hypothetical protein
LRGRQPLQYTSINAGRKAGHAVAHVMAVSKVSAIAMPIPTVASFSMCVPLLFAGFYRGQNSGGVSRSISAFTNYHRRKLFVAQTRQRIRVLDFVVFTRQYQRNHFEVSPRLLPAHLRNGLFPVLAEISKQRADQFLA